MSPPHGGGTAFFADGKNITLTADTSIITLEDGKEQAVGEPAASIPDIYYTVLAGNGADTTLTPAVNTTLTIEAGKGITRDDIAHSIK